MENPNMVDLADCAKRHLTLNSKELHFLPFGVKYPILLSQLLGVTTVDFTQGSELSVFLGRERR